MAVHPDLLNGVMRAYRDHVIRVLGWQIPNVASSAELIELARKTEASALEAEHELRTELTAFVCYDKRLQDSAHALGLPVEAPA